MNVPFIDLRRFETDFLDRWSQICQEVTAKTQFVGGPEAQRLEQRLAADSGVPEVVGCANGTDALQLALRAAGVGIGDSVLIPDATFWATFEAVVNCGARVVTVDIDPQDLQMDFELFKAAVERFKPKAAILVHLYGWGSAKLEAFRSFCETHALPLIEDAAQAYGVTWKDRSIFEGAYLATLSFYPAKVLGSCGDAGAVFCSTVELASRVRCLANHGRTEHYAHGLVGWNSRLGGFDAAYLNLSLDYINARLASRRDLAARYRERLPDCGLEVVTPPTGYVENGYLNVTLHSPQRREQLASVLKENGIGFGQVYPGPMSTQPGARDFLAGCVGGHEAEKLCQGVLNLPLYAYMTDREFERVIEVLQDLAGQLWD